MKKYKIAVIGAGSMGTLLTSEYTHSPDIEIAAVFDPFAEQAQACAAGIGKVAGYSIPAYDNYEKMHRNAVYDIAYITCPPDIQVDYACEEMNRGMHVMTQVPAALTIDDCYRLVQTVKKTGVKYQLAEQTRYWYFIKKWRELVSTGKLGQIKYVQGQYLHYEPEWDFFVDKKTGKKLITGDMKYLHDERYETSWRYRVLAQPILYLPHTLSSLLSITGGRITKVACFGTRKGSYATAGYEGRDMQSAIMYDSNDVIYSVAAGFTSPHGRNNVTGAHWYNIMGTDGSVELARSEIDHSKIWTADGGWSNSDDGCVDPNEDEFTQKSTHGGVDFLPIKYFVESIKNDTVPPMDVYKAVETAAPAILAAKSCEMGGKMLEVPDFRS